MKDFKNIADEIMKDIFVTNELKQKTLKQCREKKSFRYGKVLIPAACLVLILGIVNISALLTTIIKGGDDQNSEFNILMESDDNGQNPLNEPSDTVIPDATIKTWRLENIAEAKEIFGDSFLAPSEIPSGFKLDSIQASGQQEDAAESIVLKYISDSKSFIITEDKKVSQYSYITGYKPIDLNGIEGYINSSVLDSTEGSNNPYVEIHWIINDVHYMVAGTISEDEAATIARSMK